MPQADINLAAVLVAAVLQMVVGMVWYAPAVFGKIWMHESGLTKENMDEMKQKGMGKSYFFAFVGSLIMSYVLAYFVDFTQATSFVLGAKTGFWLWLGFVVPVLLGTVLWAGQSLKLYLVNIGHYLVALVLMSGVLAGWL